MESITYIVYRSHCNAFQIIGIEIVEKFVTIVHFLNSMLSKESTIISSKESTINSLTSTFSFSQYFFFDSVSLIIFFFAWSLLLNLLLFFSRGSRQPSCHHKVGGTVCIHASQAPHVGF